VTSLAAAEDPKEIEQQLGKTLENKLVTLRTAYAGADLKFDSQGKLLGTSEVLPWTTHGLIQVKQIRLTDKSLEIKGQRAILVFDIGGVKGLTPVFAQGMKIRIELESPLVGARVSEALTRVFAPDEFVKRFSEYWKPLVDMDADRAQICKDKPDATLAILGGMPLYCGGKQSRVTPPSPVYTLDPEFPKEGRKHTDQGSALLDLIIDENGFPAIIKAKSSSGPDFDVQAALAVSRWRFHPATRDGKPVPYMISVKVDFRLQ